VKWARIGAVGGDRLSVASGGKVLCDASVSDLHRAWMSLEALLGSTP
jgi:hypothetical protein